MEQGSTLLYNQYVVPFMLKNEKQIDSSIAAASNNLFTFATNALRSILQFVLSRVSAAQQATSQQVQASGAAQQPAANPAGSFASLFTQYAPAMFTAGAALLNPPANASPPASAPAAAPPPPEGPPSKPFSPGPTASSMFSPTPELRQRNVSPIAQPNGPVAEPSAPPFPVPEPSY
jgi:receptor expression-enhancing protein 1/2/3/4